MRQPSAACAAIEQKRAKLKPEPDIICLSIPSAPKYLRVVRYLLAELAELKGYSLKERDRICLAVGEACSNIIRHSYKEKTDGEIIIRCELYDDRMVICLRDFGEKIDLSQIKPPNMEEKIQPGGLGVHMIKCMMDQVEYDVTYDVGTEIRMTKYFCPPESKP